MEIKTRLTEKDFINANLTLLYLKLSIRIVIVIMIACVIFIMAFSILYGKAFSFSTILWPFIFLVALPMMTYIGAKRNFNSNPRIKETIEYRFGNDFLQIKGESFSAELTWDKIYKVTLTKNWLFIWQSQQIANVIPRRDVWEGDITTLKEILSSHQVKNNL